MTSELPFPLVQASWKKAMALGDGDAGFGANFYKNLFIDYPILKTTFFKGVAIDNQKMNLPKSITTVLGLLTDMPKAVEALQNLGARHAFYGTKDAHYPVVGSNLIKTLSLILKPEDFDEATKAEWVTIYGVIQKTMIDAAHSDKAAAWWARFYVKRGKELQGILAALSDKSASAAITKSVGGNGDIADTANAIVESKSVTAACSAFSQGMTLEQRKTLSANLAAAIEANNGTNKLNDYDKMVLDWFAEVVEENKV